MRRFTAIVVAFVILCCPALAVEYKTNAGVNIRSGPSTNDSVVHTISAGAVVNMLAYDAEGWSKVNIYGKDGYIRSDLLTVIEKAADTPVAGVYRTTAGVNIRSEPNTTAKVLQTIGSGQTVTVSEHNVNNWSTVSVGGQNGYISSQYLTLISSTAPADTTTAAPADNTAADTAAKPTETPPPSYRTTTRVNLRSGSSTSDGVVVVMPAGANVTVVEYNAADWSRVQYNGNEGYVKSEFLRDVSQNAAVSNTAMDTMNWATIKSKGLIPLNKPLQITDIRSGVVYIVQSFSNGSHADVEPLTTADTTLLKQTYGGVWAWSPRPVIVNYNGRSFPASINGMPHGGGVISGNGMDGQICLHFIGSNVHNGNSSFAAQHAAATQEALNSGR